MLRVNSQGVIGRFLLRCTLEAIRLEPWGIYNLCQLHRRFFSSVFVHFVFWSIMINWLSGMIVAAGLFLTNSWEDWNGLYMWLDVTSSLGVVSWIFAVVLGIGVAIHRWIVAPWNRRVQKRYFEELRRIYDSSTTPPTPPQFVLWYRTFHEKVCPNVRFK